MARGRSRAVRGDERRSGGDGVFSGAADAAPRATPSPTPSRRTTGCTGFGLWALEIPGVAPFAGFVGLSVPGFTAPFTPCVEIGWRLAAAHWGRGYATEAARAVLAHAWDVVGLDEVVSFTTAGNDRSRAVMTRIGMRYDPADDFDHPRLPPGHPLRRHVLYRVARP